MRRATNKILSLIMAACLILTMIPLTTLAAQEAVHTPAEAGGFSIHAEAFSISGTIYVSKSTISVRNAIVELYDCDNDNIGSTRSGDFGSYTFTGLTSGTYTVKVPAGTYDGQYYCEASITVTIDDADFSGENIDLTRGVPTSITTQPLSQTVNESQTATFSVGAAAQSGTLSYLWQVDKNDGNGFADLSEWRDMDSSYTTPIAALTMNGWKYRVQIYNGNTLALTSDAAVMTVSPTEKIVSVGTQNGTLTVSAFSQGEFFISGSIKDSATSELISNATIELYDGGGYIATTTSNNSGFHIFTGLGSGTYTLKALAGTYGSNGFEYYYNEAVITVTLEGAGLTDQNIRLIRGNAPGTLSISGKISDSASSNGVSNATVELYDSGGVKKGTTKSDSTGEYTCTSLATGTYTVKVPAGAYGGQYYYETSIAVTIEGADVTGQNITLVRSNAQGEFSISGRIRDYAPSGISSIENATVELYDNVGKIGETASALTGSYTFTGLAPGTYTLKVPAGTYGFAGQEHYYYEASITVTIEGANLSGQDIRLTEGNAPGTFSISGTILDNTSLPYIKIGGVTVELYASGGCIGTTTSAYSGSSSGSYSFTDVTPGTYTLKVPTGIYNGQYYYEASKTVMIDAENLTGQAIYLERGVPTSITTQPLSQTVNEGETATFSVEATAESGTLFYLWQVDKNDGNGFADLSEWSDMDSSYTTPIAALTMNGWKYRVQIYNGGYLALTSDAAVLTVLSTAKAVSVGAQNGTLTAGTVGMVTFTVTTSNIANGSAIMLNNTNSVMGISLATTKTTNDNTTVTINTKLATPQGTHPLTLTIDGVTSASFNLVVGAAPGVKTVSVGAQSGTLTAGTAGTATFTVTTANIANGSAIMLNNTNSVAGISLVTTATTNDSTTVTISTTAATPQGTHPLTLTIDGVTSAGFNLVVGAAPVVKTVSVGAQSGTLTAGMAGSVTFPVTTANIANGDYTVSVANLPTGVSVSGQVTISSGTGTLTLAGNTATVVGTTNTLTLTIDGAASAAFALTIRPSVVLPTLGGTVTISGSAVYGQTLTADTGNLTSTPGGMPGTLSYQWKRGASDIGTNSATYTIVESDIGQTVTVTVTATGCTGSVTSAATARIAKASQNVPSLNYSISGSTITIAAVTGAEYKFESSVDAAQGFCDTNTYNFTNGAALVLYIRFPATATHEQSGEAALTIVTSLATPDAPAPFSLTYTSINGTTYTVTIPTTAGAEYSFDGVNWSGSNEKTGCLPGETVTGYKRIAAVPNVTNASGYTTASVTLPEFQAQKPTASPNGGSFTTNQRVTLSCATDGASIYYTLDGTAPDTGSILYSGAFTLTSTTTVKAIAVKAGMTDSEVLTVTFVRTTAPSTRYTITFDANGGSVSPATMRTGTDGKLSKLPTPMRNSHRFDGWYSAKSGGTRIATSYVFTANTTVYAQWTYTGDGYDDGNSSSGDSSSSTTATYPVEVTTKQDFPTTARLMLAGSPGKDAALACIITKDMVQQALDEAKEEAGKQGCESYGYTLAFYFNTDKTIDNLSITFNADALALLESAGVKEAAVETNAFRFSFDLLAITDLIAQSEDNDVTVTVTAAGGLAGEATLIGKRPAFKVAVTYIKVGTDDQSTEIKITETITTLSQGQMTREIAYSLPRSEYVAGIRAVYVDEDGTVRSLTNSTFEKNWLTWSDNECSSICGVGYQKP